MIYSSVTILFVSHIILLVGAENLYLSVLEEDPIHRNVNRSDPSPSSRSGNHFTYVVLGQEWHCLKAVIRGCEVDTLETLLPGLPAVDYFLQCA